MINFTNLVKRVFSLFTVVLMIAFATGCGAPKLSDKFDEEAVKQKAQDLISLLNAQDSKGIRDISVKALKDALKDDTFGQI